MAQSSRGQRLLQKSTNPGHPISSESLFGPSSHNTHPLFLGCQGFPCLHRLLGQDEDSHILFTAGLEAPLGILFDRSIPLRLLNPAFSPFSFPFSFTIFRQDTNFNSSAPTFLKRSPTIPKAEILQRKTWLAFYLDLQPFS